MQLQPGETLILNSDNDILVLTNLHIQGNFKDWGNSNKISIFLEDISSIQVVYRSIVFLLLLAGLCGLYGIYIGTQEYTRQSSALPFGLGLIFLLAWWFTRRRVIAVHPDGGRPLEVSAGNMNESRADELIKKIQLAKAERIRMLY